MLIYVTLLLVIQPPQKGKKRVAKPLHKTHETTQVTQKAAQVKGNQKGQTQRDKQSQIRRFFAGFLQFFAFPWNYSMSEAQKTADFRGKPQETADFCRNPFVPLSLSLLIPP